MWSINPVIVAAQRELPALIGLRAAAGPKEVPPRNASFHHPAAVRILPAVEGAPQRDLRFHVELAVAPVTFVPAIAPPRQKHVEHRARRVHLELVIAGLVLRRFEEELENVVKPRTAVVLPDFRVDVRVLHLCQEVKILTVPQQPRSGRRAGRFACPGKGEPVDHLSALPGRVIPLRIDSDR